MAKITPIRDDIELSGKSARATSPKAPPEGLTNPELLVWRYICSSLRAAGMEHVTAGLAIKTICRTYLDWQEALKHCEDNGGFEGRYGTTEKGHVYEMPHSYMERQLKRDLLKWLPEACLTIPSLASALSKKPAAESGDDVFNGLQQHGARRPGRPRKASSND